MKSHKNTYIIAGPNGSGKTTFAKEFLPNYAKCPNFVNADLIAAGLSPFSPRQVAIKAGKLVLQQIKDLAHKNVDFGFETTLAGKSYVKHFQGLKEKNYKLHLFFLWIPSSQLAIGRIKDRVAKGGHDVPIEDVKRRFERSVINFFSVYRKLLDSWLLFDNSEKIPKLVARNNNSHIDIHNNTLFQEILNKAKIKL